MTKTRVSLLATATLLTMLPVVGQVASADDLRDRRDDVRRGIAKANDDLEHSSQALRSATAKVQSAQAQLTAAQTALNATQTQLDAAAALDAQMQAKLVQAEAQLAAAEKAVVAAKARVVSQRESIGNLAADNYANGDPALMRLSVILSSQRPEDMTSQLQTADTLMAKQKTLLEQFQEAQLRLQQEEARVEKLRDAVEVQRQQAAANLVRKQELQVQAVAAKAQVASLFTARQQAEASAESVRQQDLKQLQQLQAEQSRIKAMILERQRRAAAAAAAAAAAKQRGGGRPDGGGSGAVDAGGALARPVPGPVTSPYGYRTHPIYGYYSLHDGDDYRASCGSRMYAARGGEVISRYYSSVWGNRLLIDVGTIDGANITIIYNHATSYSVGVGERVGRGEVVGRAGTTGWSTGCHLHFTVLRNGDPVNPGRYY